MFRESSFDLDPIPTSTRASTSTSRLWCFFFLSFPSSSSRHTVELTRTNTNTLSQKNKTKKTQPLTLTVNNKTLIPQVRGWEPANQLVSARAAKARAFAIANATATSPNPFGTLLSEAVSTVRGKERYMKRTVAAAFGKGNTTTLLNAVILGAASATDLVCIVDPKTGQLVGIKKPGTTMCSMAGGNVTVPTSKGFISQIKVPCFPPPFFKVALFSAVELFFILIFFFHLILLSLSLSLQLSFSFFN